MNLAQNQSSELPSSPDKQNAKNPAMSTQTKENSENSSNQERQLPIPAPSHPRQYRAIGLIQAKYKLTADQLTQGTLTTTDGTEIEAVLLGRIISLVKNHLDLEKNHLWVVYPRTKPKTTHLHVQIVGVWEPETLNKTENVVEQSTEEVEDGYFSIRGEVVYYSQEKEVIVVKIKQFPRKEGDKPKFFKLTLKGTLPDKPLHHFWDLKVRLVGETLTVEEGTDLGALPVKKKPGSKRGKGRPGGKKPYKSRKPTPRNTKTIPPVKKSIKKPSK
ncbi:MAG: hypothetical protein QNJ41_15925 [Xenococcaceae cyanobacterium MO_188.B32]|nr:hypothetical protein [Xenococcaceae cyanobacterium MO_188.B32]